MLALEEPNKFDPSNVHVESKSVEEAQNVGNSSEYKPMEEILDGGGLQNGRDKKSKKKRKREGEAERNGAGDENGERLDEGLHKAVKKDAFETSPSKSKPVVRDFDRVSPGDENGERLDEGLHIDTVGNDVKLVNDVADEEAPPPTPAKKKHKSAKKNARETSPSKTKSAVHDSDRVSPESEAVVSKVDQGDIPRSGATVDMNELPSSGTSKDKNKKRKKEKRHHKSELPPPEVNKKYELPSSEIVNKEVPMQIEDHAYNASVESSALLLEDGSNKIIKNVQDEANQSAEGISMGLDKIVNDEVEATKSDLVLKSRAKKSKKSKKGDVDRVDKSDCPSEIPDGNVVEFEAKPKKKKAKKAKMSTQENMDLLSMENKDPAPSIVSNVGVENGNYDVPDETDRGDATQKTDKEREAKDKTFTVSHRDGTQEESDTGKVSAKVKSKGEKAKRKSQKKHTVSITDTQEVSVKEQSDEKLTQTDVSEKTDALVSGNHEIDDGSKDQMELDGDRHQDINKTPTEVSVDVSEVKKTRASKRKAKKHDDAAKLKDDNVESTEPVHPPPTNANEENMEITMGKQKKRTEKRQTKVDDPPESPMKKQFDEGTKEMAAPYSIDDEGSKDQMEVAGDCHEDSNKTPMEISADVPEVKKTRASKRKAKKHDDATKLKGDNGESTEPVHPPPINTDEENTEITGDKHKKRSEKKQSKVDDPPESPMKKQDEGTMETAASYSTGDDGSKDQMEVAGDRHEDSNKTPMEVSADVSEAKKTRASKRKAKKHDDATKLKDDNGESMEPVHPPPTNTDEENTEITGDKQKNRTEKSQSQVEDRPESPVKEQFDEGTKEMAPNSAGVDLLANVAVSDANHQQESSLREDNTENIDDVPPSDSASLAEVRNQEMPHSTSKDDEIVKKPDHPSSIDTTSTQTGLSKSKKSKESKSMPQNEIPPSDSVSLAEVTNQEKQHSSKEEIVKKPEHPSSIDTSSTQITLSKSKKSKESKKESQNGTKPQEPTTEEQHWDLPLTQHSENHVAEGIEPQVFSPRKTRQSKNAKEPQKKPNESKNGGNVVNASAKKKSLLATRGAIFEDGSSESSDGVDKMEEGSGSSTKTPSDNVSSDYSEGESNGYVVSSRIVDASNGGEQDSSKPKSSSWKDLPLPSVLRSSSRYRKAKVVAASQSRFEDSEAVDFVPDSQANL